MSDAPSERERLERAIAAQEGLRETLGDDAVDLAVSALRDRLAGLGTPDQRRRQATVLFADVTGFTPLAETLDAEVVTTLINDVWLRIDNVLTRHGARIDKHIGDAVMALWGADASHEGDPERAVHAALELQQQLSALRNESGLDVEMRVGITTGPVLFGSVATTNEFTAMGDTVNIASRLEHAAPVGGVLISHETYRHIRGVFDVAALEPLQVKGKSEPLRGYVVHRAKPRSFRMPSRGVEGVETKMVGRDRELDALRHHYEEVATRSIARVVTVVGEAGVGKSRLLYEFENWIDLLPDGVYFMKARALETRRALAYGVFRDVFAHRFGIRDSDLPQQVADKLVHGFAGTLPAPRAMQIGHWLGFDLPQNTTASSSSGSTDLTAVCAAHLTDHLRAVAASNPTLIVVEDLHWADDDSIDLLERLVTLLADSRVLVVAAARPSLADRRPTWPGTSASAALHLDRLSEVACRALVDEVLQRVDGVPPALADLILERTDGNPFFVEELVKMLIDDGVIVVESDSRWRVAADGLDRGTVPATLTGVLEARLDGLPSGTRLAVQRASVVGRVFWDEVVAAMSGPEPASRTAEQLAVAVTRELVYRRPQSTLDRSVEFIFKHALLRDVAYETVLLRDRTSLHVIAAEWLAQHAGARAAELTEMIADHYQLGGRPTAAADLHHRAGERSLASGRTLAAVRSIEHAIELWTQAGTAPPSRALAHLAEAFCRLGHMDAADAILVPLVDAELDDETEALVLILAGAVCADRNEFEEARRLLDSALPLAERCGGHVLVRALNELAWCEVAMDRHSAAEDFARRSVEVAEAGGENGDLCRALSTMAMVQDGLGELDETLRWTERALEVARRIGDLEAEARSLGDLGIAHHLRGDADGSLESYALAWDHYRAELLIDARLGLAGRHANTTINLAQVCLRLHRIDEARVTLRDGLAAVAALPSTQLLEFCVIIGADLHAESGRIEEALDLLRFVLSADTLVWYHRREAKGVVDRIRARVGDDAFVDARLQPRPGDSRDIHDVFRDLADALVQP